MLKYISIFSPIYVTVFWGVLFWARAEKKDKPGKYLTVFMTFAFLLYCSHAVFFSHYYRLYSVIEFIYVFCMLALYPMYYLYIRSLTSEKIHLKDQLHHFIPAAFFSGLVFLTSLAFTPETRVIYVQEILINRNLKHLDISTFPGTKGAIFLVSRITFLLQIPYYAVKGVRLAKRHNEQIENYYSNTEGLTMNWVKTINIVILLVAVSSAILTFIGRGYFSKNEDLLIIPSIVFSSLIFIIGLKGSKQIRTSPDLEPDTLPAVPGGSINDQTVLLKARLQRLFEKDKVYLHPELKISHVSEKLNTNRTYISRLINDEMGMNFNEFVNNYRVNEAKRLMKDETTRNATLELIAEKSGFGSATSFARIFKSVTGMTPGNYREKVKVMSVQD